ncbi:crotonase/enoyl-CoA hydratase family protein [Octadecabacter sp. 1_MG-2023]|uniref:crotonase/enoyl-CoA hydratase family protein n=1 Tax=unclassified Octadecabacter TaxID=196158 RepID=UPI001C083CAF|nr:MULTISPECIES: crotonase/enoyl-CoA hydratase family protein [unclassified Octadecabacter]MBU2993692.1 crotonase/enoyl-CoA hydratase family protein [Octadecabacter sp. B2R22]MDO6735464.1 crotonase/enoyl-CoA hydratase family protein [Octadecabacter sp. 1_MG-2023]
MTDLVTVTNAEGPVAEVRINRPDKKNAVTLELLADLVAAGESLAHQSGLRAVVLSGAEGNFSSGMDTSVFMKMAGQLDQIKDQMLNLPEGQTANDFQRPAQVWQDLEVPVIAAIEGVCFGAGLQIALAADFRIAAPDASLSILEAKWGLVPDMGISLSLPKLMPVDRAKALIMTGQVLSGTDALAEGLVTRIEDDPIAAAHAFADELAQKSPDAIRSAKTLADAIWAEDTAKGLALEAQLQADLMGSPNQIETVMAQMQKRAPNYS